MTSKARSLKPSSMKLYKKQAYWRRGKSSQSLSFQSKLCSTTVVREHLIRFSRFHLIENINRGRWRMVRFEQNYASSLFEFREMLECHALSRFMNLPKNDDRWQ